MSTCLHQLILPPLHDSALASLGKRAPSEQAVNEHVRPLTHASSASPSSRLLRVNPPRSITRCCSASYESKPQPHAPRTSDPQPRSTLPSQSFLHPPSAFPPNLPRTHRPPRRFLFLHFVFQKATIRLWRLLKRWPGNFAYIHRGRGEKQIWQGKHAITLGHWHPLQTHTMQLSYSRNYSSCLSRSSDNELNPPSFSPHQHRWEVYIIINFASPSQGPPTDVGALTVGLPS